MFKSIISDSQDQAINVQLIGDLDAQASDQFVEDIREKLAKGVRSIFLDFSKLEFLSSSGLRRLLAISKEVSALGGSIKCGGVSQDIMQIFVLTGFDEMLGMDKQ